MWSLSRQPCIQRQCCGVSCLTRTLGLCYLQSRWRAEWRLDHVDCRIWGIWISQGFTFCDTRHLRSLGQKDVLASGLYKLFHLAIPDGRTRRIWRGCKTLIRWLKTVYLGLKTPNLYYGFSLTMCVCDSLFHFGTESAITLSKNVFTSRSFLNKFINIQPPQYMDSHKTRKAMSCFFLRAGKWPKSVQSFLLQWFFPNRDAVKNYLADFFC